MKACKTIGQLIKGLEKLPKTLPLDEPVEVVHYNKSENAKKLGLKECARIEELPL